MTSTSFTDSSIGGRIRYARESLNMSQASLGEILDIDRSAVARLEQGKRKVSASELASLTTALRRSFTWFLESDAPTPAVRRAALSEGASPAFKRMHEELIVATRWLQRHDLLQISPTEVIPFPQNHAAAEEAASHARALAGLGATPLVSLSSFVERFGLLAFSFSFPDSGFGGSLSDVEGGNPRFGVALINGEQPPGRRRFTLAHEFGHWLFGDPTDLHGSTVTGPQTAASREKLIDAFAAHLLLPRDGVTTRWRALKRLHGDRDAALSISAEFRTSWTATLGQLSTLGLLDHRTTSRLGNSTPRLGDFEVLGLSPVSELDPPELAPGYRTSVLRAYRERRITTDKSLDLLFNTLSPDDLPERPEAPRARRSRSHLRPANGRG